MNSLSSHVVRAYKQELGEARMAKKPGGNGGQTSNGSVAK